MPKKYSLGILVTHPIQYYVPWYRGLANHPEISLQVFYCHRQTAVAQGKAGFGVNFDWDVPLFDGYSWQILKNKVRNPDSSKFFGSDTPDIAEIISRERFDAFIVQGWNVLSYWQAIAACKKTRTPILVRGDSQLSHTSSLAARLLRYFVHHWFVSKFDAYLAVGRRSREYFLRYGADEKKIFFVAHCVDNDFFALNSSKARFERDKLRQKLGIPAGSFVFLFAGKLIAKKRPQDFLRAIKIAGENNRNIFGLITGDGPLRQELEHFVKDHGLPVVFTGFLNQSRIAEAYSVADMLVLPSDERETWGLVVNEAFACNLAAITSDEAGCTADLIIEGQTGKIFPCRDFERLAGVLEECALNPATSRKMGDNARNLIDKYSIKASVDSTKVALDIITTDRGGR